MRKAYSPNNFCPCGSNVKYKKCCQSKGIDYFVRDGKVIREDALTGQQRIDFEERKQQFVLQYGRPPHEEEEKILRLSGGYADLNEVIEADLVKRGMAAAEIYAYRKTGILVVPENESQLSAAELSKWHEAIAEYKRLQGS